MVEEKVGFLCSLSAALNDVNDRSETLLKSYYLMRCKDLSRGIGLPDKQFSSKARCPHCCAEWKNYSLSQLKPVKLSKKQRRKIKSHVKASNDESTKNELLHCNQLELYCSLCKHKTMTTCVKPKKAMYKSISRNISTDKAVEEIYAKNESSYKNDKISKNKSKKKIAQMNVYSKTKEIFSLQNNKNSIPSSIKKEPKIIKNNKKRKDKFAGLCKQAVLTVLNEKKDKLSLFLKPSS